MRTDSQIRKCDYAKAYRKKRRVWTWSPERLEEELSKCQVLCYACHKAKSGEYARGAAHTNSIESVWAVMKRGFYGVYHHASPKHLSRYVDEFTFRLNQGNVARHTLERLDSFIDATVGKRITYKELIAEVSA